MDFLVLKSTSRSFEVTVPNEQQIKGQELEKAVKFIQETILSSDPKMKGTEFIIETNVRDKSSGVLHEIDVVIKTHPNSNYEAKWIFECKNWAAPVDKNQVIILAEKVEALNASRGYLVAKSLTSEAEKQLSQKPRLKFIRCNQDFWSPFNSTILFYSTTELLPISVKIKERGVPCSENLRNLDFKSIKCTLKGEPVDFLMFMKPHVDELVHDDFKRNEAQYRNEGVHWGQNTMQIRFSENEFKMGDLDVEYLVLPIQFTVKVQRRQLHSKFELEGQGRVFFFEPVEDRTHGTRCEIQMVHRL